MNLLPKGKMITNNKGISYYQKGKKYYSNTGWLEKEISKAEFEKHDGYCLSVVEQIDVKDLEKSKYKDDEIDLLSAGKYEIWIRL